MNCQGFQSIVCYVNYGAFCLFVFSIGAPVRQFLKSLKIVNYF